MISVNRLCAGNCTDWSIIFAYHQQDPKGLTNPIHLKGFALTDFLGNTLPIQCRNWMIVVTSGVILELTFKSLTLLALEIHDYKHIRCCPTTISNITHHDINSAKQLEVFFFESAKNRSFCAKWLTYFEIEGVTFIKYWTWSWAFRPCSKSIFWLKVWRFLKTFLVLHVKATSPSYGKDCNGSFPQERGSHMKMVAGGGGHKSKYLMFFTVSRLFVSPDFSLQRQTFKTVTFPEPKSSVPVSERSISGWNSTQRHPQAASGIDMYQATLLTASTVFYFCFSFIYKPYTTVLLKEIEARWGCLIFKHCHVSSDDVKRFLFMRRIQASTRLLFVFTGNTTFSCKALGKK